MFSTAALAQHPSTFRSESYAEEGSCDAEEEHDRVSCTFWERHHGPTHARSNEQNSQVTALKDQEPLGITAIHQFIQDLQ